MTITMRMGFNALINYAEYNFAPWISLTAQFNISLKANVTSDHFLVQQQK